MAEATVPVPVGGALPMADAPLPEGADWRARLSAFMNQPAVKRALPAVIGLGVVAVVAALYMSIAQGPQRILHTNLSDSERAKVVEALDRGGIAYSIDSGTGAVSVAEADLYPARMLISTDGALPAPEGASEMLDSIPLGSSRTLEGERLRLARERELMLTIREIDGIESVRVHLATPERSVFVRQNNPPSASVMVRLVSGRSLSENQVNAIVNLVSGSVPGMTADNVRVVDQNGKLLSSDSEGPLDSLILQREFEGKLREQVTTLLMPLLGDGNFSSQVQVELDQSEITSARESYDQDGVVRSESERSATRMAGNGVGGVPGVPANTPPPDAELVDGAPEGQEPAEAAPVQPSDRETALQRNYELGREVAVTNTRPGGLKKLSVAVAVSSAALEAAAPMTAEELQSLVSAAVGADENRGDKVQVVVSAFESAEMPEIPFYEAPWFFNVLRIVAALIAVLMVLLLAVRPLLNAIFGTSKKAKRSKKGKGDDAEEGEASEGDAVGIEAADGQPAIEGQEVEEEPLDLPREVDRIRQLTMREPDRAVEALQRMIVEPEVSRGAAG